MALTLNNIDINVKYGLDASNDVSKASSELFAAYDEGIAIIEDLRACWTGDNATRYIALLEERVEQLRTRSNELRKTSGAMRETVLLYEQQQKAQYYEEQRQREEAAAKKRQAKK